MRSHLVSCLPAGRRAPAPESTGRRQAPGGSLMTDRVRTPGRVMTALAAVLMGPGWLQGARVPQSSRQATVRFAVAVNYVEVYAVVEDGSGGFVRELTPEDFELYEEGKLQDIARFAMVDIPLERPTPVVFRQAPEPDVRSNTQVAEGRVYLIVLDDDHTAARRTLRVRQAARQFIVQHMAANDIAAVAHTGGKSGASQEFTSSKRLLLAAVDQFHGRKLRSATLEMLEQSIRALPEEDARLRDPLELERAQRARDSLEVLEKLSKGLRDVHGRRKAILYFGEGIDYDIYDVFQNREATSIMDSTRRAVGEATRANVAIYTIDPRGLTTDADESAAVGGVPLNFPSQIDSPSLASALNNELLRGQDSLREISAETGGLALLNWNDYARGLGRIVEENSHYYLLGYYPTNKKRDGKYRKIEVRLKRPGLVVRARKGYVAPTKEEEGRKAAPLEAPEGASAELHRLAQSPLPLPEIPMRATAWPFRVAADKALVPLVVEMAIDGFRFEERDGKFHDDVELSVIAVNTKGKVERDVRREFNLSLRPATRRLMAQAGFRVMTALELPSGRYQLRAVVYEAGGGSGGSLFYDVEVPSYDKSDLIMTPLVVTSAAEARVPVIGAQEDKGKLFLLPATRRSFSREDRLVVVAEVYPRILAGARPPMVEISTTIRATDENVVFRSLEQRGGEELTGVGEGIVHKVEIPLTGLAPGDYLLEMRARDITREVEAAQRVLIEVF